MSNIYNFIKKFLVPYVVTFIIAAYNLRIGSILSPESFSRISSADYLIAFEFNYFIFFDAFSFVVFLPEILIITLIAFLKILFPYGWMEYFLYINITVVFFIIYLFQRSMLNLKINNEVVTICCFLFIFSIDFLTWPRYILIDTIYVGLSFILIITTLSISSFNTKKIFTWFLCILLILLSSQNALPIVVMSIFLLSIYRIKLNGTFTLISLLSLFLLTALLYSIFTTQVMNDSYLSEWSQQTMSLEKLGIVIHSRPETYINISNDFFGFLKLFCYRFFSFFNPYASSFSSIHNVFNSVISIVYFSGLVLSTWNWKFITSQHQQYFLKLNLFIFSIAIFHSSTLIDSDWRFRFPTIILMIMVGAISMQSILNSSKTGATINSRGNIAQKK